MTSQFIFAFAKTITVFKTTCLVTTNICRLKKKKNKQPKQTEKIENDGTVLGTLSNLSDFL